MRFGSVCSGIEAASVAWNPLGWEAAWFAEIEPFPSAVLAHHYPNVPNHGDMTELPEKIFKGEVEAPDMLCGGTPCFTEGQMVLAESGYKPIEEIQVGEMVMTHKGRLKKVLRTGHKIAHVGTLEVVGHQGFVCTPNHPFLSINRRKEGRVTIYGKPEWVSAEKMPGQQWCSLINYEETSIEVRSAKFANDIEKALLLAGMYVGDGYTRRFKGANKKNVMLCLNDKKLDFFKKAFPDCGACVTKDRTAYKVAISDTDLAEWLVENFGELSHNKTIPSWLLGHPNRDMFTLGYQITDGYIKGNMTQFSTVSKALAFGSCDLMNSLGYATSVTKIDVEPTKEIEGRTVNQSDWYQVRAWRESRKSRIFDEEYLLRLAQHYDPLPIPQVVYNIEVEEDNSYILEGAIVHNCQAFSVAGQRKSLDDERGNLSLTFCEIADAIDYVRFVRGKRPAIVFWENVPGVLNTKDNALGCFLGRLVGANLPLTPGTDGNKWPSAGYVAGPKRQAAWRILDAQHFGVPQRRRRVFVVASARADFNPGKVLFESPCVSGDSESSSKARQSPPGSPEECARGTGYREGSFGQFVESELAGTTKASGGVLGGGSETLIIK